MVRKIVFTVLLCYSLLGNAQQTAIDRIMVSGRVVDSISKKPIEFATISFSNNENVLGTTTGKNGYFEYSIKKGMYTIKVEFLSYKAVRYENKKLTEHTDLGTLYLSENFEKLNEVQVVAQKDLVEYQVNKKIYNASKDIANLGGNALDVLNNTPAARVDGEGNVVIRGATATVLIDGKPVLGLNNGTDILRNIPSSTIEKVEIITRTAKYDAQGSGGILNIITKKRKGNGLSGSLDGRLGLPENNGVSVFLNESTDKINIFSTVSLNNGKRIKRTELKQSLFDDSNVFTGFFDQEQKDDNQKNSFLFNIGSDFYLNDNNTLTTSILVNTDNKNYFSKIIADDYDNSDNPFQSSLRNIGDFEDVSRIETFLNYTTKFDADGHELSVDFKYDNTISDSNSEINDQIIQSTTENINQKVLKDQSLDNFLVQLDYALPITDTYKIELGHKSSLRFYENDFEVKEFNPSINDYITVGGFDDVVNYDEKVYAFYGQLNAAYEKLSFSLGLRSEISNIGISSNSDSRMFQKNYTDFFPSATLAYEFNDGGYLSVNYSRSIDRPQIYQLNPFISINNERFQSVGNPDLNPYYQNYFELLYDKGFDKVSFASAIFLNYAKDQFLSIIQNKGTNADDLDIFTRTFINSGNKNIIGADLDITYRPVKWLRLNSYISPYKLDLKNTLNNLYDYSSTVWYAQASILFSFESGLRLQGNYYHQSPIEDGLTKLRTINFANFSVSKDIFKKKAIVAFKVVDAFNSKWFSTRSFEAQANTLRNVRYDRQFTLTFTYRFNQKRRSSKDRSTELGKDRLEDKQDEKL